MHTLFTLEDNYGLKITEQDGELALQVDFRKNKDAARLHEMLWAWREQAAKLEAGEISQEDYDRWRYHYPEYDSNQIRARHRRRSDLTLSLVGHGKGHLLHKIRKFR